MMKDDAAQSGKQIADDPCHVEYKATANFYFYFCRSVDAQCSNRVCSCPLNSWAFALGWRMLGRCSGLVARCLVRRPVRALAPRRAILRAVAPAARLRGEQLLRGAAQVLTPATVNTQRLVRKGAKHLPYIHQKSHMLSSAIEATGML